MHELPITKGILSIALETSQNHGSRRVTAIDIVIGQLSSIVDDSIQFYFDALSEGTLTEDAQLKSGAWPPPPTVGTAARNSRSTPRLNPSVHTAAALLCKLSAVKNSM